MADLVTCRTSASSTTMENKNIVYMYIQTQTKPISYVTSPGETVEQACKKVMVQKRPTLDIAALQILAVWEVDKENSKKQLSSVGLHASVREYGTKHLRFDHKSIPKNIRPAGQPTILSMLSDSTRVPNLPQVPHATVATTPLVAVTQGSQLPLPTTPISASPSQECRPTATNSPQTPFSSTQEGIQQPSSISPTIASQYFENVKASQGVSFGPESRGNYYEKAPSRSNTTQPYRYEGGESNNSLLGESDNLPLPPTKRKREQFGKHLNEMEELVANEDPILFSPYADRIQRLSHRLNCGNCKCERTGASSDTTTYSNVEGESEHESELDEHENVHENEYENGHKNDHEIEHENEFENEADKHNNGFIHPDDASVEKAIMKNTDSQEHSDFE